MLTLKIILFIHFEVILLNLIQFPECQQSSLKQQKLVFIKKIPKITNFLEW